MPNYGGNAIEKYKASRKLRSYPDSYPLVRPNRSPTERGTVFTPWNGTLEPQAERL